MRREERDGKREGERERERTKQFENLEKRISKGWEPHLGWYRTDVGCDMRTPPPLNGVSLEFVCECMREKIYACICVYVCMYVCMYVCVLT